MTQKSRFTKAADNTRPYNSRRFDVYGVKIRRGFTLFGPDSLDAWVLLEADPDIESYCERPIVITDVKPRRVIDFWVCRKGQEELHFLLRPAEKEAHENGEWPPAGFRQWASSKQMQIRCIDPDTLVPQRQLIDNWGRIIHFLSANGRYASPALLKEIKSAIEGQRPIKAIEACFPKEDPTLVKTAVFSLLHQGIVKCGELSTAPLNSNLMIEAA